jgi:hypothetical protein
MNETTECLTLASKKGPDDPECELKVELEYFGPVPDKYRNTKGRNWRYVHHRLRWSEDFQTFVLPKSLQGRPIGLVSFLHRAFSKNHI